METKKDPTLRRILLYLGITFGLTYLAECLILRPLALSPDANASLVQLLTAGCMFFPALGALLTRLLSREGFRDPWLLPKTGRRSIPWFFFGWFAPALLTALGAALYFLIFPGQFDPQMGNMAQVLESAGVEATPALVRLSVVSQIVSGLLLAPLLNFIPCFGEEWGWRGYLLPKLREKLKTGPLLLASGLIWGLWHMPLTVLGHNYGTGYPGYPFTGILAMCLFCTALGTVFSYITLRTGSCLPAVLAHGSMNGFGSAGILFFKGTDVNPFLGPLPTGIIGGAPFLACALIMGLALLRQKDR